MIMVKIATDSEGNITSYEMSGHADYGPHGEDIVCAAASVLGYTTLRALVEVAGVNEAKLDYKVDDNAGYMKVKLETELQNDNSSDIQVILKTYDVGIRSMIESYPKYITLEYVGGGNRV
ncbi:ribosomal-processing cysteine protease Prp [Gudongella sp. DL1XJH-153]|uniref:ribosomal-processing cysteine protease Prp n=1 Tax=Gudongella sp. DL1XJH-153 TaxID=3409804 RepID=UPI003BB61C8A